eukprot:TRINITY_DN4541_c0_g1_i1.p1 TRINITY_DN4541_c0_g1~~TRINITY_DN4541_c0_g1_i1.p1  ORF type:complete len:769 (+),score=170.66 TRINITY_DN4541_c0_g1_i1:209-2308(+)
MMIGSRARHASEVWCTYVGCLKDVWENNPTCDMGSQPLCTNNIDGTSNRDACNLEYEKCHSWSCTVDQYDLVINCLLTQECVLAEAKGIKTCSPTCHAEAHQACQKTHSCGTHNDHDQCVADPFYQHCDNKDEICQAIALAENPATDGGGGGLASWIVIALLISGSTSLVLTATLFVVVRSWRRSKVLPQKDTNNDGEKDKTPPEIQITSSNISNHDHKQVKDTELGVGSTNPLIQSVLSDFDDTEKTSAALPAAPPPSGVVSMVESVGFVESIPGSVYQPHGTGKGNNSNSNIASVTPSRISFNIESTVASIPPSVPNQSIPVVGSMVESIIPAPFTGGTMESVTSGVSSTPASSKPSIMADISTNQLSKWHKAHLIGKGSFGEVFLGILQSGYFVAVKVVDLGKNLQSTEVESLLHEVQLMRSFRHKNITRYLDAGYDPGALKLHIFMEFVDGGSLSTLVKKLPTKLDDILAARYTKQILEGLLYLHEECHTIHRDIKGENVLIRNDGVVKLADFGCSKQMQSVAMKTQGCETMVGTPYWMAPEVISVKEGQVYGFASDVWSVGCTVSEMLNRGEPPWPVFPSMWAAIYNIGGAEGLPTNLPQDCSPLAHSFMVTCLVKNPKERPIVSSLLTHEWVADIDVSAAGIPAPGSIFATDSSLPNPVNDSMRTAESATFKEEKNPEAGSPDEETSKKEEKS